MNIRFVITLLLTPLLSNCAITSSEPENTHNATFTEHHSVLRASTGCAYRTTFLQPTSRSRSTSVVLAHGFLRSQANMRNLAEIIVQSGFAVTTLDLCNMKLWNGQHRQNALEMIATARHWGIDRVVYAGFSAGALAALGAAARDSNTQGLLLLDFVDRAPIGERALSTLSAPVYALNGEPAPCNAHGRGMQLFTTGITVEKIPGASHCAFESPSDTVCRLLCRANNTIDEQARKDINRRVVDSIIRLEITGSFTSN